jgi:hypothetical protein
MDLRLLGCENNIQSDVLLTRDSQRKRLRERQGLEARRGIATVRGSASFNAANWKTKQMRATQ